MRKTKFHVPFQELKLAAIFALKQNSSWPVTRFRDLHSMSDQTRIMHIGQTGSTGKPMQKKLIGLALVMISLVAILWIAYGQLQIDFWRKPPHEKLSTIWTEDIATLTKSKKLPKEWNEIKEVTVKTDNSPLHEWLPKIKPPIPTKINGRYRLETFFVLLLDGNRYGTVVEYDLIDISSSNKVWELGRTYKLGLFY
jgi:hypothetical protein